MPKKFDCTAQRIADVMEAVEKVKPVVALIRELDALKNEIENLEKAITNNESDISVMKYSITEMSVEDHKKALSELLEGFTKTLSEKENELDKLMRQRDSIEDEIAEYLKYANSFYYIGTEEILLDLLGKAVSENTSEEEFFSILFILRGEAVIHTEVVKRIAHEYANKATDDAREKVLMFVDNYNHETICELIKGK